MSMRTNGSRLCGGVLEHGAEVLEREVFVDQQTHRGQLHRDVRLDAARADRVEQLEVGVARPFGLGARRVTSSPRKSSVALIPCALSAATASIAWADGLAGDEPLREEEEALLERGGLDNVEDCHGPAASA